MGMVLRDMIQELFAVQTTAKHSEQSLITSGQPRVIVPNNPNRLSFLITNIGNFPSYVAFEKMFVPGNGIYLAPNGGFLSFLWDEDFDVVGWELRGIASGGTTQVNVLQIISI